MVIPIWDTQDPFLKRALQDDDEDEEQGDEFTRRFQSFAKYPWPPRDVASE